MSGKPMTVAEMARMGGIARAKAHSKAELRVWGRQGGRPGKLDRKAIDRLRKLRASGKSQKECATVFKVSVRTIGRIVARMKAEGRTQGCLRNYSLAWGSL
jgi:DNA invertase Pin-like site-specific DNA recombinase